MAKEVVNVEVRNLSQITNAEATTGDLKLRFQIHPGKRLEGGNIVKGEQHLGSFNVTETSVSVNLNYPAESPADISEISAVVKAVADKVFSAS